MMVSPIGPPLQPAMQSIFSTVAMEDVMASPQYLSQGQLVNPGAGPISFVGVIPDAGEYVIGLHTRHATVQPDSVTAAGAAASPLGSGLTVPGAGNSNFLRYYSVTTTGAGDIIVSHTVGPIILAYTLWRREGFTTVGLIEASDLESTASVLSATLLAVPDGSAMLGLMNDDSGNTSGITWTGITEDHDTKIGSTSRHSAASGTASGTGNKTITATLTPTEAREGLLLIALPLA